MCASDTDVGVKRAADVGVDAGAFDASGVVADVVAVVAVAEVHVGYDYVDGKELRQMIPGTELID